MTDETEPAEPPRPRTLAEGADIVHLAGVDVQVGQYLRQRCSWCGAVLVDYDLERVMVQVQPDGTAPGPATWPIGSLVALIGGDDAGSASWVVDHVDGHSLPLQCCALLEPEATA